MGISLFVAVGCSYSRVYLGYHTAAQVYVGSFVGSALGMLWYELAETETVRRFLISLDVTLCELERARMEEVACLEGSNADEMKDD